MNEQQRPARIGSDVFWLLFLAGLAVLPPVGEVHKQFVLLAFGVAQLSESWVLRRAPRRGAAYIVLLKIALATLLIDHTGELSINSSYWPIYFSSRGYSGGIFQSGGYVVMDGTGVRCLLFLSLSRAAGI